MTDTFINLAVLVVSLTALAMSTMFWARSFRPIVTAAVETHSAGRDGIAYNLVILNSGSLPARNVQLRIADLTQLEAAISQDASDNDRTKWLACFEKDNDIALLQNGTRVSCSFGMTRNTGTFWRYGASFPMYIHYRGYFGTIYQDYISLRIVDSDSFTGHVWGTPRAR